MLLDERSLPYNATLMRFVKTINWKLQFQIGVELGLKSLILLAVLPSSLPVMVCEEQRRWGLSVWRVRQSSSQRHKWQPKRYL